MVWSSTEERSIKVSSMNVVVVVVVLLSVSWRWKRKQTNNTINKRYNRERIQCCFLELATRRSVQRALGRERDDQKRELER